MKVNLSEFKHMSEIDEFPDLSFYGQYQSEAPSQDIYIDRKENRVWKDGRNYDMGYEAGYNGREYRYFIPYEVETKKQALQDFRRMETYGEQWNMLGVWVQVSIFVNGIRQTLRSAGLWGIESDSDTACFDQIYAEQEQELIDILSAMGIEVIDE